MNRIDSLLRTVGWEIQPNAFGGELVPTEADLAQAAGRDYETAEQRLVRICVELAPRKPENERCGQRPRRGSVGSVRSA